MAAPHLHEETSQQGSLNVEGVGSRTKGGYGDWQLDPPQGVDEFGTKSVGHQQSVEAQVEVLTPPLHVAV